MQIHYGNVKHLNEYSFNRDLKLAFRYIDMQTYEKFEGIFMNSRDHHTTEILKVNAPHILVIFRKQFSLFRSLNNYFRILIFIPVERANCWKH